MHRDLNNLATQDLRELLICKTTELLNVFQEKHPDGAQIHSLQVEVEEIREAIQIRRGNPSLGFRNQLSIFCLSDNFNLDTFIF
jgi:hypothetical protein